MADDWERRRAIIRGQEIAASNIAEHLPDVLLLERDDLDYASRRTIAALLDAGWMPPS